MLFQPIYLHFLDRELSDALGYRPPPPRVVGMIETLLWATPRQLYCGFATNWELVAQISHYGPFLSTLVNWRHLDLPCHYGTVGEFIASMQPAYLHDECRHPEYFDERLIRQIALVPTHVKGTSATRDLARAFHRWSEDGTIEAATPSEAERELRVKRIVRTAMARRRGEAIRFPFFKSFFTAADADHRSLTILRRRLSAEYTRHYLAWTHGDIATGIPELAAFDTLAIAFPFHDVAILDVILSRCGIGSTLRRHATVSPGFLAERGLDLHRRFCRSLRIFLAGCAQSQAIPRPSLPSQASRSVLQESAKLFLDHAGDVGRRRRSDVAAVLEHATRTLDPLIAAASRDLGFRAGAEAQRRRFYMERERIVIMVATDREQDTVINSILAKGTPIRRHYEGNQSFIELGTVGGCDLYLARSEMGSGGVAGSQNTTRDAILALAPSAVIMVGIAYGLQRHKQNLGDVLVSKQIAPYELQRISSGPEGKYKIVPRYDRPSASPRLLNRFRDGRVDWTGAPVHYGLIMSGEKLSDSKEFCEALLDIEPEAIGGEMEAAGLYSATEACKGSEWIMVKGICDWGYNKDDAHQQLASKNAVDFLLHVVRLGGLAVPLR